MAGIMRVLLGALPFLLPTFFFLSFFYDLLLPRVGAHAFPPPLPSSIRGSSDRGPRSRSNLFHFFFSALLRAYNDRVYPWKCRISIELGPRSHFSIDYTYIYIYRFVFRNRILLPTKYSPIYLIFTFYSRIDDLEKFREEGGSLSIIYYLARVIGWKIGGYRNVALRYVTLRRTLRHCVTLRDIGEKHKPPVYILSYIL